MRREEQRASPENHGSKETEPKTTGCCRFVRSLSVGVDDVRLSRLAETLYADLCIPFSYVTSTIYKQDVCITPQHPESIIRIEVSLCDAASLALRARFSRFFCVCIHKSSNIVTSAQSVARL